MPWSCTEISMGGDYTITDAYNFSHVQMYQYTHIRIILVYACMQRLELISPAYFSKNSHHRLYQCVPLPTSCLDMASVGLTCRPTLSSWLYLRPFLGTIKWVETEQRQKAINYEKQTKWPERPSFSQQSFTYHCWYYLERAQVR